MPSQLSSIHWNTEWNIKEINKTQLYHPMKRIIDHSYIRESSSQSVGRCLVPPS